MRVDTRNGIVDGKVSRIDPAVQSGTVQVDVELTGELPRGARPDLSVDGTIEIERLAHVVFMGRPAFGQPNTTVGIFKIVEDGRYAVRIPVELGRTSVNAVEILKGLVPGDRVILSDTSGLGRCRPHSLELTLRGPNEPAAHLIVFRGTSHERRHRIPRPPPAPPRR